MKTRAYAKINIGLDITGIREDGYHLLDMVMQTVDLYDELEITPRDDGRVVLECDEPGVPTDGRNLAVKAFRALIPEGDERGVSIFLKKNIPSQAGLGGGSSDAAEVLKAANVLCGLGKTPDELETAAAKIGADVPFFIKGGCQRCRGIGEILSPAEDGHGDYVVIVKPEAGASTKDVYAAYDRLAEKPECANVLEAVTAEMFPVIREIKEQLLAEGAELAGMSGSGTAVFGIFKEMPDEPVIAYLRQKYGKVFPVRKKNQQTDSKR
ncbi:MAG: 4-(cytidine 5'-diphospho)-2-C-methyl-D-erythritol kinase [Lachnospiraceae bacterium]|nr:4-(cytidine 5'-diphospho)-2-C-methyl-D-erythritol kinase [Candidatus Darwinimomas equi]